LIKFFKNYPLKEITTFHIQVNAKTFAEFTSPDELKEIITSPEIKQMPLFILGGGSNVLFTGDFDGVIIRNLLKGIELTGEDNANVYVKANAGELWHYLVMYCVNKSWGGIENLSLIPGTVGAGPIQNIGAYGVELKDTLVEVETLDVKTLEIRRFSNSECQFGYRDSIFKNKEKDNYIILSVTLKLKKNGTPAISYHSLQKELEHEGILNPTIVDVSNAVIKIRSSKLPDPAQLGNAGSFFKNPVIPTAKFEELKTRFPPIVSFPAAAGYTKLAAAWLIEQCGWKGKRFGDAGVHQDQALVLVNYANATGKEILNLATKIIESVKDTFGVELEKEVMVL
jgi:UDP-N-acetylmuramate dehydrogenase